jgi:hypothetical protein
MMVHDHDMASRWSSRLLAGWRGKPIHPSETRSAQLLYCAVCRATRRNKAIAPYAFAQLAPVKK